MNADGRAIFAIFNRHLALGVGTDEWQFFVGTQGGVVIDQQM